MNINLNIPSAKWSSPQGNIEIYPHNNGWTASLTDQNGIKTFATQILFKDYKPDHNNITDAQKYFKECRVEWKNNSLESCLEIRLKGLLGGGCVPSKTSNQWENHLHNVIVHPKKIIYPTSLLEIVDAFNHSKRIKAAGSGHSYNPLCDTTGTLILTHDLNRHANTENPLAGQLKPADLYPQYSNLLLVSQKITREILSSDNPKALIEVEAGVTINNLSVYLESLGLAVYNLGGANVQTLAGAFSTSTHGSGVTLGPLHSCVRSLVLCTDSPLHDNEAKDQNTYLYRIEPTHGITNSKLYNDNNITLVQNDQVFNSVIVSLGCCGIIYSYVLEVIPSYDLAEYRKLDTWESLKEQLQENKKNPQNLPSLLANNRHFELIVNPYITKGNTSHKVLTTTRNIWQKDHPDYKGPKAEERNFLARMGECELVTDLLADFTRSHPDLIPTLLDKGLEGLANPDVPYVAKCFDVFNIGANPDAGFAFEIFFPITDSNGNYQPDQLFKAMDRLFFLAEKHAEEKRYQTAPLSVRFVKGDPAYLSMVNHGSFENQIFAAIELLMLNTSDEDQDIADLFLLERLENEMYALGARVHWGLDAIVNQNKLQNFPKSSVNKWKEIYSKLNAKGTFSNDISDSLFADS